MHYFASLEYEKTDNICTSLLLSEVDEFAGEQLNATELQTAIRILQCCQIH